MTRECHVRFCEGPVGKFYWATLLFGGGPPQQFAWIYHYHPGRSGAVATRFFENFKGYLHVDGYSGYHKTINQGVTLVGCMAHARRKFFEVAKLTKKKKGLAHSVLKQIGKLYKLEKQAKESNLSFDEVCRLRQEKSKLILEKIKHFLDEQIHKTPHKSPLGSAIFYMLNQWNKLIVYLEDGRLEIDNNRSERAIKPFVIGRKNWLFSDTEKGAESASYIYSLIETCKAHDIEPYAYLRYLLTRLPKAKTPEALKILLPYHCDREAINAEWLSESNKITVADIE